MNDDINLIEMVLKSLIAAIDPLLLTDPRVKRRMDQYSANLWQSAVLINLWVWISIWVLTIFLNDWSKPNYLDWLKYRLSVISFFVGLLAIFYLFRRIQLISFSVVLLLAGTQSIAYSWSYSLGAKMPKEFIVLFSTMILATCIRSFFLNITLLASFLFASKPFWQSYVNSAWVFTDYEIAVFFLAFAAIGYRAILKNRENSFLLSDFETEKINQEQEFYQHLLSFVSPTIVRTFSHMRKPEKALSEILIHDIEWMVISSSQGFTIKREFD